MKSHGMTGTRIYSIWRGMKKRCHVPSSPKWKHYGARGITVCAAWRNNFIAFLDWALSNGYHDDLQIDRKDNDLGYSPENCHFVTCLENNNNKRFHQKMTVFGQTKNISEWARDPRCTVGFRTMRARLLTGWEPERVLLAPLRGSEDAAH